MEKPKILLGFLFYLNFKHVLGETAYLKFCGTQNKYAVDANTCPIGVWFEELVNPGCVCVKGVWALSNSLCDESTAVLVGDNHCFYYGFRVRSIKFLGDPGDPFATKLYSATAGLDYYYELKNTTYSEEIPRDTDTLVLGINPRASVIREDKMPCLQPSPESMWKPVHIYQNAFRGHNAWKMKNMGESCDAPTDYTYHVGFGDMYRAGRVYEKEVISRKCASQCPVSVAPKKTVKIQTGRRMHTNASTHAKQGRAMPPMPRLNRAELTINPSDFEQETKEQTIRMMHAQINPILLRTPTVQVHTAEYSFFQEARQIMLKVCPASHLPEQLLNGLTRMWRLLLWESHDKFTHTESPNKEQFKRIMDLLQVCKDESVPFEFTSEPVTEDEPEEPENTGNMEDYEGAPPGEDGGETDLPPAEDYDAPPADEDPAAAESAPAATEGEEVPAAGESEPTQEEAAPAAEEAESAPEKTESAPEEGAAAPEEAEPAAENAEPAPEGEEPAPEGEEPPEDGAKRRKRQVEEDNELEAGKDSECMKKIVSVKGKRYDGVERYVAGEVPSYLQFDFNMDFVTETAWKIVLLTHYQCGRYFNETSIDHSHLMSKLESFFNGKIIKRWHNNFNAYKIVQIVFHMYDLDKFVTALDRCVGAAKELSAYRHWILRPKVPLSRNDLTSSRMKRSIYADNRGMLSSPAKCIDKFRDPVDKFGYTPRSTCSSLF